MRRIKCHLGRMPSILIVEDEVAIADTLLFALQARDSRRACALAGEALAALRGGAIDLVILDVGLPDMTGFEACKALRQFSTVPVMFLTARAEEVDRVVGLEIGADDYVVKPFRPREVVARVRAILKRSRGAARPVRWPACGGAPEFDVDAARLQIRFLRPALKLTALEFRLLQQLLAQPRAGLVARAVAGGAWAQPPTPAMSAMWIPTSSRCAPSCARSHPRRAHPDASRLRLQLPARSAGAAPMKHLSLTLRLFIVGAVLVAAVGLVRAAAGAGRSEARRAPVHRGNAGRHRQPARRARGRGSARRPARAGRSGARDGCLRPAASRRRHLGHPQGWRHASHLRHRCAGHRAAGFRRPGCGQGLFALERRLR